MASSLPAPCGYLQSDTKVIRLGDFLQGLELFLGVGNFRDASVGSSIRHTPLYYTYGLPGSWDEN